MEAIYEFDVKDMPVTVAVDAHGTSVHETGPREWQRRIGKIPVDRREAAAAGGYVARRMPPGDADRCSPRPPMTPSGNPRKHCHRFAADTVTTLNLPPVRMGLLTKLNLLTVGLIFLTAVAITAFYVWQQWRDDRSELRSAGRTSRRCWPSRRSPALHADRA